MVDLIESWSDMRKYKKIFFSIGFVVGIILLAFYLADLAKEVEWIRDLIGRFGYIGLFLIALISGFNIVVPIPAVAFIPLMLESGLRFWPSIILISLGVTLADILAYFIGKIGHDITSVYKYKSILDKLEVMREKYGFSPMLILFLFASFAPLPNELLVVPLGFMGYKLKQILPFVFMGNLLFNIIYASTLVNVFEMI